MAQTKEQCLEFLEKAREAVSELSVAEDGERQMERDEQQLVQSLEAERKRMTDAVQATLKKRRQEIVASYDSEMNKVQDRLKKARAKREKAKNQGIRERIAEETQELCTYNKELQDRMRDVFRRGHVPMFCRTRLYFSLYHPRWAKEMLRLLVFVALFFAVLPWGVYLLLPEQKPLYLAAVYVADILIFGSLYVVIGNRTKTRYLDALQEARQILDLIYGNDRKIKVITSTIRKDKNEAIYDLEKYDDDIARLEQEANEVAEKKRDGLSTFETVTQHILQDEIESPYRERIRSMEQELAEIRQQLKVTAAEVKERRLAIANGYAGHLGREFLEPFKLQELAGIIREDQAASITEAIEVYRKRSEE